MLSFSLKDLILTPNLAKSCYLPCLFLKHILKQMFPKAGFQEIFCMIPVVEVVYFVPFIGSLKKKVVFPHLPKKFG